MRFEEQHRNDNVSVVRNQSAWLHCPLRGELPIHVQWLRNRQMLVEGKISNQTESPVRITSESLTEVSPPYELKPIRSTSNLINARLWILNSDRIDNALFECRARNDFGSDSRFVHVLVREAPAAPLHVRIESITARSLSLRWQAPFDGHSPILHYMIHFTLLPLPSSVPSIGATIAPQQIIDTDLLTESTPERWPRTVNVTGEFGTIRTLHPFQNYSFTVVAVNRLGIGPKSESLIVQTNEEAPSNAPVSVTALPINASCVQIHWNSPPPHTHNGILRGFYVGIRAANQSSAHFTFQTFNIAAPNRNHDTNGNKDKSGLSASFWTETRSTRSYSQLICQLKPYTEYVFVVQAFNSIGAGPRSDAVLVRTSESLPVAAPTLNPCTSNSLSDQLSVSWNPVAVDQLNGRLLGYKLHIYTWPESRLTSVFDSIQQENVTTDELLQSQLELPPNEWQTKRKIERLSADRTQLLLNTLRPFTNYTLSVQAVNSVGDGPLSALRICRTAEAKPDAVRKVNVVQLSSDSLLVSWQPPRHVNGRLRSYTVYRHELSDNSVQSVAHKFNVPAAVLQHKIGALRPGSVLELWISATNEAGEGEHSERLRVTLATLTWPPQSPHDGGDVIVAAPSQSTILRCSWAAQPPPTVRWWRDGQPIACRYDAVPVSPTFKFPAHSDSDDERLEAVRFRRSTSITANGGPECGERYSTSDRFTISWLSFAAVAPSMTGNYTCAATNSAGRSERTIQLIVRPNRSADTSSSSVGLSKKSKSSGPESLLSAPRLRLLAAHPDRLMIGWAGAPGLMRSALAIDIYFRPVSGNNQHLIGNSESNIAWNLKRSSTPIDQPTHPPHIQLEHLECGTAYHVHIAVDSVYGRSANSETILVRTFGREPITAGSAAFFTRINSTAVRLQMDSWKDGGCPLLHCKVSYRLLQYTIESNSPSTLMQSDPLSEWTVVTQQCSQSNAVMMMPTIGRLSMNAVYKVRVEMRNSAGQTSTEYELKPAAVHWKHQPSTYRVQAAGTLGAGETGNMASSGSGATSSSKWPTTQTSQIQLGIQVLPLLCLLVLLLAIALLVVVYLHRALSRKLNLGTPASGCSATMAASDHGTLSVAEFAALSGKWPPKSRLLAETAELSLLRSSGDCLDDAIINRVKNATTMADDLDHVYSSVSRMSNGCTLGLANSNGGSSIAAAAANLNELYASVQKPLQVALGSINNGTQDVATAEYASALRSIHLATGHVGNSNSAVNAHSVTTQSAGNLLDYLAEKSGLDGSRFVSADTSAVYGKQQQSKTTTLDTCNGYSVPLIRSDANVGLMLHGNKPQRMVDADQYNDLEMQQSQQRQSIELLNTYGRSAISMQTNALTSGSLKSTSNCGCCLSQDQVNCCHNWNSMVVNTRQ